MKINAGRVTRLRKERHWSQEQLVEACGLNLRTIQRLENEGNASMESARALAAVFELDANELILGRSKMDVTPLEAIRDGFVTPAIADGGNYYFWYPLAR